MVNILLIMVIIWLMMVHNNLVGGIQYLPLLKNMKVSWGDYSPYMEKTCSKPPTRNRWKPTWHTVDGCEILHHQKDVSNLIHNGINHLSTGTGFFPSKLDWNSQGLYTPIQVEMLNSFPQKKNRMIGWWLLGGLVWSTVNWRMNNNW